MLVTLLARCGSLVLWPLGVNGVCNWTRKAISDSTYVMQYCFVKGLSLLPSCAFYGISSTLFNLDRAVSGIGIGIE